MTKSAALPDLVDEHLDKQKQKIIKDFKQQHLISAYFQLDNEKRQKLLASMETIQFDLIDLVACRSDL